MRVLFVNGLPAESWRHVLKHLASLLLQKGYVTHEFAHCIRKREEEYPTGLALDGSVNVALPHCDPGQTRKPVAVICTLRNPVDFMQMGGLNMPVRVSVIILVVVDDLDSQVSFLHRLADNIVCSRETREAIYHSKNSVSAAKILSQSLCVTTEQLEMISPSDDCWRPF